MAALRDTTFDLARLPQAINAQSYARDYDAFARAVSSVAPHVPLLAPALANPLRHLNWISTC